MSPQSNGTWRRLAPGAFAAFAALALASACSDDHHVNQEPPEYVYVVDQGDEKISGYAVDPDTGKLTELSGSPFPGSGEIYKLTVDPQGAYIFTISTGYSEIGMFHIDRDTGGLDEVSGTPFNTPKRSEAITVDPSGNFVITCWYYPDIVSVFEIDRDAVGLAKTAGSPYATDLDPHAVAVDPTGAFVYTANNGSSTASGFSMNASSGALSELSSSPYTLAGGSGQPRDIAVAPSGDYAYVAEDTLNAAWSYKINTSSGKLSPTSPDSATAPGGTVQVELAPSGAYAYFLSNNGTDLYRFQIGGDGTLRQRKTYTVGTNVGSFAIDPNGAFLYVSDLSDNTLTAYTIDPDDGTLSKISGSSVSTGKTPSSLVVARAEGD